MSRLTTDFKMIVRIGRRFRDDYLRPYGVDSADSDLLLAIFRTPGASQDRLSEDRMINKSTIARRLLSLEERGLVRRTVSPDDRRTNCNELTEKGTELVPILRQVNDRWSQLLTRGFSEEECRTLQALLDRVLESSRDYAAKGETE